MSYKFLVTRRDGPVEYLVLNRPDVRNAFNAEMIAELSSWAADTSRKQGDVRAVAVTSQMFRALDELPMPVIGRVHGAAIGGGAGLAAVCDIVVATDDAVFGFTEVKLGIIPAIISPFVLNKIGPSAARELFVTGARFPAARAYKMDLVHAVVAAPDLDETVARYLAEILASGPEAIAAAKTLIRDVWASQGDPTTLTADALARRRASAEGQEGLRAFLEKRKPRWSV